MVFLVFGIVGVRPYISSQTGDQVIIEMGVEYLATVSYTHLDVYKRQVYEI